MEISTNEYQTLLDGCIDHIHQARRAVAKHLNSSVMGVYWYIGSVLSEKQLNEGYGSGIVNRLSSDLKSEFPDMGLSPRNLWDMKRFYEHYKEADAKLRQAVAVLPWGHNLLIINKTNSPAEAQFYATVAIEKGLSRESLLNYIKTGAFEAQRQLPKSHNFGVALPQELAQQANEILKSSYNLGFLGVTQPLKERELEARLVEKVKHFILELGKGFSYVGNQYRLEYNQREYFVDMLFFHRDLKALVAIELKIGEFKPEYVGKMNAYLTLLDRMERREGENPPIGIILCADKNHLDVEIALQDIHKPIGVAEYQLLLPKKQLEELIINELK
jgi:predicted nuclease of restriction endonuclease-like (RecB) superfamily|nr:PDDEXK nuclease domain-containing protein [Spirosomataceae bacterium]